MDSQLDNLDSRLVASLDGGVRRERNLGQADGAGERVVGGAEDLELGNHGVGHVERAAVGTIASEAHVDVGKGSLVAAEPTWLEGDGTAGGGPVGAVLRHVVSTA